MSRTGGLRCWVVCMLGMLLASACDSGQRGVGERAENAGSFVVVATLDTGANLFHPTFRRGSDTHPAERIPGYPGSASPLALSFADDLVGSIEASGAALASLQDHRWPMWVPGTNIIGTWAHASDALPIFDAAAIIEERPPSHAHGAQASSQIAGAGAGHSLSPDALLVIVDTNNGGSLTTLGSPPETSIQTASAAGLRWASAQPWVDVIHTNIQNLLPLAGAHPLQLPRLEGHPDAVQEAVAAGKMLVAAAGNYYVEFTETSPHTGPQGVLVVGANDNCESAASSGGYTEYSNPNPHVVMDGNATVSAAPSSFADQPFGGTSSASPRAAGYVAQLLLAVRRAFGDTQGSRDGYLLVLDDAVPAPEQGPLADGKLHARELHEVVRKTADPNPHASEFDGDSGQGCIPQPGELPSAFYPKMGYGEISELTLPLALDVLLGVAPMPERPVEDAFFGFSEQLGELIWTGP